MSEFRVETDSMGEVRLPRGALYGAQTQRAVENFPISGKRFSRPFLRMLGEVKYAAAVANRKLGKLDKTLAEAIMQGAQRVASGEVDNHFPIDVFQTGSGTSTNMNANEVIANIANTTLGSHLGAKKPVHPNDHVNLGQSSNDVIPTVLHLAIAYVIKHDLLPALSDLHARVLEKEKHFQRVVKIGRTHLMDATPLTLGQVFSGFAQQIAEAIRHVESTLPSLYELAIGGTAVGTGINTHPKFAKEVCAVLEKRTHLPVKEAVNHFAAQGAKDACVSASGALKRTALVLMKIADDIRWLGSGPRAGLGELILPDLQPGSSIMPGKVNPVIPEVVVQIACQVIGNDAAVTAGAMTSNFELNVAMPLLAVNLLESVQLLSHGSLVFAERCLAGLQANEERCRELMEQSLMLVTPLAKEIGYDRAAEIAKKAYVARKTIREVVLEEGVLDGARLDQLLNLEKMTEPQK